ncbi:NAD(P)-binding protein [Ornithinimicrobium panacihumi]|uniref:NAD(P)-binding protein n=1 Tax=Ornithinimicrobium panacihumi TaxID=2008449 RepID=UPI003F8B06BB
MPGHSPERVHPHERPISFGEATAVVMGMGRIGRAVAEELTQEYGLRVLGVENLPTRVAELREQGMEIVEADAADADFWHRLESTGQVEIVVLAMPFHGANRIALQQLVASDYSGVLAAVAQYDDEAEDLRRTGADVVINLYDGAGASIAERAAEAASDRQE